MKCHYFLFLLLIPDSCFLSSGKADSWQNLQQGDQTPQSFPSTRSRSNRNGLGRDPEHPLCRGFTIAEIQRIDFSKLDLREVFEELMKNYKPGKMGDIGRQVGERLETIKKGMVTNGKQPQVKQREGGA